MAQPVESLALKTKNIILILGIFILKKPSVMTHVCKLGAGKKRQRILVAQRLASLAKLANSKF